MLRFVILEHDHRVLHWDFMLEVDGVLRTWRLPTAPSEGDMPAEQIADHRLAYLDYEGPVSGGRGAVKRWDRGTYRPISFATDSLDLILSGDKRRARVLMTRVSERIWQAIWSSDLLTDAATPSS